VLKYKPVARKIKPIASATPPEFRVERFRVGDPLADLPALPTDPPEFLPGKRLTAGRAEALEVDPAGFLWPQERKLVLWLVRTHEEAFAWEVSERGMFREDMFPPLKIPTIDHKPWVHRNILIPPAIYSEVVRIIKEKISAGVYEPSTSSYRSRWFCVVKKDGKSLRLVHDLQPLNAVSIQDAAVPPFVETIAEAFAGHSVFGILDLMVGYDHRTIHEDFRDLTTFQSPVGSLRLTKLPMGYTNAVQIFHGDVCWILQEEISDVTVPFIDDCPVKGPKMRYERPDGSYETIPKNPGIRRFIFEHLTNMNRVLQRLKHAGATVSAKKFVLAAPSIVVVGHKVSYEGRVPDESKVQKIRDWPYCTNVTEVRGFLGLCSYCRVFIKDFAKHARPLIELTRKDAPFLFEDRQRESMDYLKHAIVYSPVLRPINYESDLPVILAVDTSSIAVGYVLMQLDEEGRCYPARFGLISLNDREQRYSQAKLELFGLFRALRDVRLYIFGVKRLVVEVDARYIKGMINNPDLQPNATINRWIASILLFSFELTHVPADRHAAPDGLSRRPPAPEDPLPEDDYEDWVDDCRAFAIELFNRRTPGHSTPVVSSFSLFSVLHSPNRADESPPSGTPDINQAEAPPPQAEPLIPRSDKARDMDERLEQVREFLTSESHPSALSDQEFEALVRRAIRYFLRRGELWRKERGGRHQVVARPHKRYSLIKEAHDELGHKGAFSVRSRLLVRFWWPMLEQDVKWYVRSCHECQVRWMDKLHIPPVVALPQPLFYKAYMDTFLMPKSGGY